ncbi:hypothetical protein FNH04_31490 [Streptomyces phyllanthi]|uniref:LysR substrate-binding domain-containing protein n=1 Tax=Streptomyces phyllanthi TaxID=1803180 RepID=A0A5N8W9X0_9ACTN|nr:hypothetical protein [Streptomyces phyllanthi]
MRAVGQRPPVGTGHHSLCEEHLAAGRLVLLHDPAEPPLNTLFLVQRPGAEANPDVIRVRETLQRAARAW